MQHIPVCHWHRNRLQINLNIQEMMPLVTTALQRGCSGIWEGESTSSTDTWHKRETPSQLVNGLEKKVAPQRECRQGV